MAKVDFYITKQESANTRWPIACRLAATRAAGQSMYILCDSEAEAKAIDDLLWSLDDISFIPHANITQSVAPHPPVLIGYNRLPDSHYDILLNLSRELPALPTTFTQIMEIVCQDPEWKNIQRNHYKAYQTHNFPLESQHI
jgi:DNA polymerase-3 subunit chi